MYTDNTSLSKRPNYNPLPHLLKWARKVEEETKGPGQHVKRLLLILIDFAPPFLQWFTEESGELWMRHCKRDFKRESPQEYESWREMYLRLHDERKERLKMLTQNIHSSQANKPKGRRRIEALNVFISAATAQISIPSSNALRLSWQGARSRWHL